MDPKWQHNLTIRPDDMVNTVAISDDANRIVAGTWYHNYSRSPGPDPIGPYAVYLANKQGEITKLEEIDNCFSGIYTVAMSPSGNVAAAGGWLANTTGPGGLGLLRAYDTASGKPLFPSPPAIQDRVNSVSLSGDGKVLAAAADKLYVFFDDGTGYSNPIVVAAPLVNPVNAVAVHPTGEWLVCSDRGHVLLATLKQKAINQTFVFDAPDVNFRSVAVARSSNSFVAAGGKGKGVDEFVYHFSITSMTQQPPAAQAVSTQTGDSLRWVAISADGGLVTAVSNDRTKGLLIKFSTGSGQLTRLWQQPLKFKPNSTSMSADGKLIAASDGFDADQLGGNFYLFDENGTAIGDFSTAEMSWPIAVSATGEGVAGGSDDGNLYFFMP